MDPTPLRDVLTVGAGVATGVLSAAFGVGGAVVSTPAIRALGASATIAIGTTLPSVLPSAASGSVGYARQGLIAWRVVSWTAPTGIVASIGGSLLTSKVPGHGHVLQIVTAALLGITAWRMSRPPKGDPSEVGGAGEAEPTPPPAPVILAFVGVAAGAMSGLLGIGGGIVMVPAFVEIVKLPVKPAVATSLVCVGIFALPGTITHSFVGDIDWRYAVLLAVGVIPGAQLGARLALRASDHRLRVAVAAFLGVLSLVYGAGEIAALF